MDLTDDWAGECVMVEEGRGCSFQTHSKASCPRASTTRLVHPSISLSHCCALAAVEHHIACEILAISKINRAACTLAFAHTSASEQGVDTESSDAGSESETDGSEPDGSTFSDTSSDATRDSLAWDDEFRSEASGAQSDIHEFGDF